MADDQTQNSGGTIDLRGTQAGSATTGATGGGQDPFAKFEIPDTVKQQYPDLIPLIVETESMNDEERQYWFQILPIMTTEQVDKLRKILENEKQQLQKLDNNYQNELKRINDKHVSQWKAFESKEKRQKLKKIEGQTETEEKQSEEELLKKLQDL